MANGRNEHFHSGAAIQQELDKALKLAQIQKLNASAAKDRQAVRRSIAEGFKPMKGV